MSQKVEKFHKGGGGSAKNIKKSKIRNLDFLIRGGGGHIFIFFPNVNAHFRYFSWRENKVVLKWFLGNFKCFKLKFHVLRGGSQNSKFGLFDKRGGESEFSFFSQIQMHTLDTSVEEKIS